MSHIFISYSRKDLTFAQRIVDALAAQGLDTWIDWKSIPKTVDWEEEIYRGIEEADAFLFMISPDSVQSGMCNKEIANAVKNGKRIIPIVIRDTDVKIIQPAVSKLNWIFCRDGQDDFNTAVKQTRVAIHTDYEWLQFHTKLQIKAIEWEKRKDASRLLRGKELREAEQRLADIGGQKDPQPTLPQRQYILASRKNQERQRNWLLASAVVVAILMAFLGVWGQRNAISALQQAETAQAERNRAEEQANIALARQLAAQAKSLEIDTGTHFEESTLLAVESLRRYPNIVAVQVIERNLDLLPFKILQTRYDGSIDTVAFNPNMKLIASVSGDNIVYVWDAITSKKISRMENNEQIRTLAFSPDGEIIVTGNWNGTVSIWDVITGNKIAVMQKDLIISTIAFSPDGKTFVTGGCEKSQKILCTFGSVRVWETATGREVSKMTHDNWVTSVAFSPDGKLVVSGSIDNTARVWDANTGREVARMTHESTVNAIAFSPDGNLIVSGDGSVGNSIGAARVWVASSGQEIARMTHDGIVYSVAFSPDGKLVVTGSGDGTARVWEAATSREIARMVHSGLVYDTTFSPDGKLVASVGEDGTARVWEAESGQEIARIPLDNRVSVVAFSPDGTWILIGCDDGTLQIWKFTAGSVIAIMKHDKAVTSVAFSSDGKLVVTGSGDGTARVWEVATGQEIARMTHGDWVTSVAFSPNGKLVVSGSMDNSARVWDAATGHEVARMTHGGAVHSVAFSPDSEKIVSASCEVPAGNGLCSSSTVRIWEAATGHEVTRITQDGLVFAYVFSPDGKYVASGSGNGSLLIWDASSGFEITRMSQGDWMWITAIAYSPDGKRIVSGGWDGTVIIWNAINGHEISHMQHDRMVFSVAFSPDVKWVASGGEDGTARVWEADTGREVARMTHDGTVHAVTFSPNGKWVASASCDKTDVISNICISGTVRVWEAATGLEVARTTHNGEVDAITFSPDGRWVVSGSSDGIARIWMWQPEDLIAEACRRLPRNLTHAEWLQFFGTDIPYHITCPNLPDPDAVMPTP